MQKRVIIIVFVTLLIIVSVLVYLGQQSNRTKELLYSGTIEARESDLSFQVSGRVITILADEGQSIEKGQPLAELDQSEYIARLEQAKANLDVTNKDLQQFQVNLELSRKNLPAEVRRAEAGLEALRARLNELETGYRIQDVEKARLALLAAESTMKNAQKEKKRTEKLYQEKIVSERERDAVLLQYETALRAYEQAKESADQLREGFREETVRAARARLAEGESILNEARENLKKIESAEKAVESAQARVNAAESALKLADLQLSYTRLLAPFTGIITSRNLETGEVVSPGREVFSMADLSSVDLKIFVDETSIGKVKPGQMVHVKVDSFPDKVYEGKISFISPETEFTPKIIQTHKERVKLVYLVKVLIPNPELELKSGMPADAVLR